MQLKGIKRGVAVLALGFLWASSANAQQKSVAEEILDILRDRRQISEQQYKDLLIKAQAEEESRLAALETAREAVKQDRFDFRAHWKNGIRLDSGDGEFKIKLGGRIQHDWAVFDEEDDIEDAFGEIGSGTRFRRAQLYAEGEIYENIKFKAQYDFAGSDADFKDVYLELKKLPWVGKFRIGHFKEPFSLEELTSSKYVTFMERSLPNVFSPSDNSGFMFHNSVLSKRATWAIGAFREVDNTGDGFDSESPYNLTLRLTGLPWYEEKGRQLLHLGLSYSHKFRNNDDLRYRQRPETGFGPRFVDTGTFATDGVDLINPEVALIYGPFSLQGEYTHAIIDSSFLEDPDFDSFYVYGSYFLTGENRRYKTSSGAFDRVSPKRNFNGNGGLGAWEVGIRYSHLDLDDGNFSGGELGGLTVGINWYLNPSVRVMSNYVFADLDTIGDANVFQTRFMVDF